MLKIGDAIISEQMFIGIQLDIKTEEEEVVYLYEALWQYGNRVISSVVRTVRAPVTSTPLTPDEINRGFKIALESIEWNRFV